MKVSIIIRAYNAEKTLARAIESALGQSFPKNAFEIIVIDDGSTDQTLNIARTFKNVRAVTQENAGAIMAANRGLKEARGEYVSFLDADDRLEPNFVSVLVPALESNPDLHFVYCDYWEEGKDKRTLVSPRSPFEGLLGDMLFRAAVLRAEGGFRTFLFAEYELLLRTIGRWRSVHIEQPLFTYVRHASSISANKQHVMQALEDLKSVHPDKIAIIDTIRTYD